MREISEKLKQAPAGSVAMVASARQTNEELYLLAKLAKALGALTDSVPRTGEGDRLLLNADRNPNSNGARLTGIAAEPMGSNLPKIAEGIRSGRIKTLIVFGEDVTRHGMGADLLGKLETLIVSDILPERDDPAGALPFARLRPRREARHLHQHQRARAEVHEGRRAARATPGRNGSSCANSRCNVTGQDGFVSIEGLFNQMAAEVPAFNGLTWAGLGDTGVTVRI